MGADADREKAAAAAKAVELVKDGMTVGLGTGSTAAHVVRGLGVRVKSGLRIRGVPTSRATETLAREVGIPLVDLDASVRIDLTIDGADEVDANLDLVKGGGAALLREKLVAVASERVAIVVDSAKVKPRLGAFPLPVEVVPFAWQTTAARVARLGAKPVRREKDGKPVTTDGGNYVLDCPFGVIADAARLARELKAIVGVVEHGLFVGIAHTVLVGRGDGVDVLMRA